MSRSATVPGNPLLDKVQEQRRTEAKELVLRLLEGKMTPQSISKAMDDRVSARTIYRWSKGESGPQQQSDYDALLDLVGRFDGVMQRAKPGSWNSLISLYVGPTSPERRARFASLIEQAADATQGRDLLLTELRKKSKSK